MKSEAIITGIGFGTQAMEIQETKGRINSILLAGGLTKMNTQSPSILLVVFMVSIVMNVHRKRRILKVRYLNTRMEQCLNLKPGADIQMANQAWIPRLEISFTVRMDTLKLMVEHGKHSVKVRKNLLQVQKQMPEAMKMFHSPEEVIPHIFRTLLTPYVPGKMETYIVT